jgi:cation:H+ antiporter
LPEYVVGLTIIAAGTSAPEFVVSLVAALRGAYSLSTGNLLGSVAFNYFAVLGVCGVVLQPPLAEPVMAAPGVVMSLSMLGVLLVLMLILMWTRQRLSRVEGAVLLLIGIGYWVVDLFWR